MDFVFVDEEGAIIGSGSFPTIDEANLSVEEFGFAVPMPEAGMPDDTDFWNGLEFQPRPSVPTPTVDEYGYKLAFDDPPSGLRARVYDAEITPPHLLYDGPLSAPDCSLRFVDTSAYLVELEADFPFQPRTLTFTTPIVGPLDA